MKTEIVLTNVVVRDKKTGEVVKGLKASDFTILENGKPQTIASFDYQNVDEAAVLAEKSTVSGKATMADLLNRDFAATPEQLQRPSADRDVLRPEQHAAGGYRPSGARRRRTTSTRRCSQRTWWRR